jgi:hypothetical protein
VLRNLESRGRKSTVLIQLLDVREITKDFIPKAGLWGSVWWRNNADNSVADGSGSGGSNPTQTSCEPTKNYFITGNSLMCLSFIHQWLYSPLLGPGLFFSSVIFDYIDGSLDK